MRKSEDPAAEIFSVLLLEKDADSLHLIRRSLEVNRQFLSCVDQVATCDEAFRRLRERSYHLLLFDAQSEPEMSSMLGEMDRLHIKIPFVLMTDVRDDELVRKAIKAGASDFIVKSESQFQELAQKLKACYVKFHANRKGIREFRENLSKIAEVPSPADRASVKDNLTGLYNHSYLHDRIVREFSAAQRYNYPLSCLMIDLDHFRMVNEKHGYRVGEEILKQAAELLFDNCRLSDCVARYGGEEFAVMLPHVSYEGALELANRLRSIFASHTFFVDEENIQLTLSIGVTAFPEDKMKTRGDLLLFAEQALSRAKTTGRNSVCVYRDMEPILGEAFSSLKISEDQIVEFQRRLTEISITARKAYTEASKALITALEHKDRYTVGHASSCARYALHVAEAMGLPTEEAEVVQHAALLHDIGKICIPDSILLKTGRLTLTEFETMKQHPYFGYKILKPIKFLQQEAVFVLHHHEWFNGEGYPCKLKGYEIPLGARIISVIDTYDTMRAACARYKKTTTVTEAVKELIAYSGIQFDPEVVKAFIEVLKSRGDLSADSPCDFAKLEEVIQTCRASR